MAQIKIRRKRHMMWWPVLLLILIPLAWYLLRLRERPGASGPQRDTAAPHEMAPPGSVPANVTPVEGWFTSQKFVQRRA